MKARIDSVVDAEFGEDYAGRADGLTVKSKPDIDAYLDIRSTCPSHKSSRQIS